VKLTTRSQILCKPDYILLVFSEQWRHDAILRSARFSFVNWIIRPEYSGLKLVSFGPQSGLSQSYLQSIAMFVTRECEDILADGIELANKGLRLIVLA